MDWFSQVFWSSGDSWEITNWELIILIPLCLFLLYDLLLLVKVVWWAFIHKCGEIDLIYEVRIKATHCYYVSQKIALDEYITIRSAFSAEELLIPFHKWMLNPFKWTMKSRFVKDGYKALMKLDSYLQDL